MSFCNNIDFFQLKDKVVLVTGSSSGLGANTAKLFAALGAKVVLHGRSQEGLDRTRVACLDTGCKEHNLLSVVADVLIEDDIKRLVAETVKKFGCIDILVNNVGVVKTGGFFKCSLEDLEMCLDINMKAMFMVTRHVLPYLMGNKGVIVNVSSFTAQRPVNDYLAYCLSKTCVDQFTKSLALEMGPMGIRVNSVNPGIMRDTALWTRPGLPLGKFPLMGGFIIRKIADMYPLGRSSKSEEVAPSIIFMASETTSSFITGVNLLIDGGKALTTALAN